MHLYDFWFLLIAVLWIGYFFLEGFDFGVGILTRTLARDRVERRVLINTIGPVWDGNEVWLLTAGGAMFAAFPEWYATLFSGFYLPLLAVLLCLIVRGVAFEYRAKRGGDAWQTRWEWAIFWTSLVVSFLWGVAFANIVRGVPIGADKNYTGDLWDLLNPYALLGGVVTLLLFTYHGLVFVALKTAGDIRVRANALVPAAGAVTALPAAAFLIWTQVDNGDGWTLATVIVTVCALAGSLGASRLGREGWAFVLSGATVVAAVATLFLALFPNVMRSSTNTAYNLTAANASSGHYTLTVMTWVAVLATPVVLAYQAWTYWVFRRRIGTRNIPAGAGH